jgi:osmotically-inducible protein OsmY
MKVRIGTLAWTAAGIAAMAWLGTREAGRRPVPAAEASAARRDRRLRARVRAALAGQSADPDAIEVVVNDGHVSLRGRVREDERDRLLERVLHTPGVVRVDNRLAVDEERPSSLATLPGATGAASAGAGSGSAR